MDRRQYSTTSATPLRMSSDTHDRPSYEYPHIPTVRKPAPAFTPQAKTPSRIHTNSVLTTQSAGASDTSGSSRDLYEKHINTRSTIQKAQRPPRRECHGVGFVQHEQHPGRGARVTRQDRGQPEMRERSSPALAYTMQHTRVGKEAEDEDDAEHALWILFWLSALDPIHSLVSCLFNLVVVLGLFLATPIRLLQKQGTLSDQVIRTVAPVFRHHLEMMYAPSIDDAFSFQFAPVMLVSVQIISPIVSIGVMFAAWVAGAFWVFAMIMGNPDGTERRDDGADAVIAVRNWWEKYLLRALRRHSRYAVRSEV